MRLLITAVLCLAASCTFAADVQVDAKSSPSLEIQGQDAPYEVVLSETALSEEGLPEAALPEDAMTEKAMPEQVTPAAIASQIDSRSEGIPYKSSDLELGSAISDSLLYLGLLFAVAAVAVFLFKRRMVSTGALPDKFGSHIHLVDRKTLSTKTTLHLLKIDGRDVVLAESSQGHAMLELGSLDASSPSTRSDDS